MDEKRGLGIETKFDFKYADERALDSLRLGEIIDLTDNEFGLETLAYAGITVAGIIMCLVWSLALLFFGNAYVKRLLQGLGQ
jgi:hypothetical protein